MFDIVHLKVPGSDGDSVCEWVKGVFSGNSIDSELNNTSLVLIPKVQNPENFAQFWPISLCSVLYKLIKKIIANRFKVVFPKLIAQKQESFVVGRIITDNIIITQEVIHSMKSVEKNKR
ncbi:reverse transcriptase [Gossypium australe]|uniref:Reverse transcriptase n=1 Tax=Gossypium australe TaxID=47621 RepID=A0A5B6VEL7_9ROSI|nr:reverse transcriptase [Gossypium australe]